MALIKCRECGSDVSTTAKTCPKCGAKMIVPQKYWKDLTLPQKLAGLAVAGVIGYFAFNAGTGIKEKTDVDIYGKPPEKHEWQYSTSAPDKMTGEITSSATLVSETTLKFDFPYKDSVASLLLTRTTEKNNKARDSVFVQVTKGQFLCRLSCTVSVKFDGGAIEKYSANMPHDGITTYIFLRDPKPFIERLRTSKRVIIEADFFKNSGTQMEFSPKGLRW